jgi:hypothetical protein
MDTHGIMTKWRERQDGYAVDRVNAGGHRLSDVLRERLWRWRHFLAAFFLVDFFFGVNGFGGVASSRRRTSSSLGFGLVFIGA